MANSHPIPDRVAVAVLGGGSAGEQLAQTVAKAGMSVVMVEKDLVGDHLVIATGSSTIVPDINGLARADPWTFVEAWTGPDRPASMLVIGGGWVGIEIAQTYATYGTDVTLVDTDELLGGQAEPEVAEDLTQILRDAGVDVRTGSGPDRIVRTGSGHHVDADRSTMSAPVASSWSRIGRSRP